MNRIALEQMPVANFVHNQSAAIWNKVSEAGKASLSAMVGDLDPFSWEGFCDKLQSKPAASFEKVHRLFDKHGVNQTQSSFDRKHVLLALSALHTPYLSDLGDHPFSLTPSDIKERLESLYQDLPELPTPEGPGEGLKGIYKMVCQDAMSRDYEKSLFLKEIVKLPNARAYWEYLTKLVAGRDLEPGMIIPALGGRDYYYVYKKINRGSLFAYALKPVYEKSDLKPVLFFRPTQISFSSEKMLETLMDNFSFRGVGYEGFTAAEKELSGLMNDENFRPPDKKIVVAGFSLAGVHAQRFISLHDHWKHFSEAIIFNSPGIDATTAKTFAFKINMGGFLLSYTPVLSFFRTEGDVIDQGGERHVGWGVFPSSNLHVELTRIFPYNPLESRLSRHMSCYLHKEHNAEVVDAKCFSKQHLLNNARRFESRNSLEIMRRVFGFFVRPIYRFFSVFSRLVDIISLQQIYARIRLLPGLCLRRMRREIKE